MSWLGRTLRRSRGRINGRDASTVYAAAALVLAYPDEELIARLPEIETAVNAAGVGEHFAPVLAYLGGTSAEQRAPASVSKPHLTELQATYAQDFDYSRRHALHLTFWIDGDTRRRGESLLRYKQAYRDSGLWVNLHGELPDYLPMVLEFAIQEPELGRELLDSSRPALELLRLALRDDDLPHEGVLAAICATLPGESPEDRLSVSRMEGWQPPVETVGLAGAPAPYGSRLPLIETSLD